MNQQQKSELIVEIARGNPGALWVLLAIDAEQYHFSASYYFSKLKQLAITGSNLWVLHKDVCKSDMLFLKQIIEAVDLNVITSDDIVSQIAQMSPFSEEVTMKIKLAMEM
jgi:hypothetical protein